MGKLKNEDLRLLREVVRQNKPSLIDTADLVGDKALTENQREELREVLADELCSTGLKTDGEPNERGIRLDSIIGNLMSY
jgi:hypothetical protein